MGAFLIKVHMLGIYEVTLKKRETEQWTPTLVQENGNEGNAINFRW